MYITVLPMARVTDNRTSTEPFQTYFIHIQYCFKTFSVILKGYTDNFVIKYMSHTIMGELCRTHIGGDFKTVFITE